MGLVHGETSAVGVGGVIIASVEKDAASEWRFLAKTLEAQFYKRLVVV